MTTNSINNINRLEQAGFQSDSKKAEQTKNLSRKKDTVEISRKNNESAKPDATYSKESIQQSLEQVKAAGNLESVHDLEKIKEKIAQGYYNSDQVIDSVVNRIIDQLD
jgi:hypothetical protein